MSPTNSSKPKRNFTNMARYQQHRRLASFPTGPKQKKRTKKSQAEQRATIAGFYKEHFYRLTDMKLNGPGGVIPEICKALCAHPAVVSRVVKECKILWDLRDEYNPTEKKYFNPEKVKVKSGSFVQDLIAKYKGRFSAKTSTVLINAMRKIELGPEYKLERHYIGITAIKNATERMKYIKYKVKNIPQASDNNLHWVKARLNFCAQLLVRLGRDLPEGFDKTQIAPAKIIDREFLESEGLMLSLHQIAFWDEIHIKQKIGEILEYIFKFAKNENDVYDENAEIDNNQPTAMVPKFAKEGRSSNGVALVINKNTDRSEYEKGIRLKPFFILEKK